MVPDFETALNELLASYASTPLDEQISALELALYALKEQEAAAPDDPAED